MAPKEIEQIIDETGAWIDWDKFLRNQREITIDGTFTITQLAAIVAAMKVAVAG